MIWVIKGLTWRYPTYQNQLTAANRSAGWFSCCLSPSSWTSFLSMPVKVRNIYFYEWQKSMWILWSGVAESQGPPLHRWSDCPSALRCCTQYLPLKGVFMNYRYIEEEKIYTVSPSNINDNCSTWMSNSVKNWWNNPMKAGIVSATSCFLT